MDTRPSRHAWLLALTSASLMTACTEGELPAPMREAPVRTTQPRPPDPTTDPTAPLPYETEDMGEDAVDMTSSEDMPAEADMGSGDMDEPGEDMAPEFDMNPFCPEAPCAPGQTQCQGAQVSECMYDVEGCLGWGPPMPCPGGVTCAQDACPMVTECVDNDNDGYGPGCLNGSDCDDNDPERHENRVEVCDGKDNDCNNLIDDGVSGVGDPCTEGLGACEAAGSLVCDATGALVCDAVPGMSSPEMCDMIDNDCNGVVDDGGVCGTPTCSQDNQEPNDSLAAPFAMTLDTPIWGFTCAGDLEFFELPVTSGQQYRINLAFPHSNSDLDLKLYKNGQEIFTADSASDHEGIQFTAEAGATYSAEVVNYGAQDNFYRLNLVDAWACDSDDVFEANDAINTATLMPEGWRTPAYACSGNDDWYYLGQHPAGTTLDIDIYFSDLWLTDDDLDMALYADSDGDNMFEQVALSDTGSDDESIRFTTTYESLYFVRVFPYGTFDENSYEILWTK